jgi:PilZ domain
MSNQGPFGEGDGPKAVPQQESSSAAADKTGKADSKAKRGRYPEMQSATRFPIKLPVSVKSGANESHTETQNISANGVLFQVMDSEMPVGSAVDFTISLPGDVLGAECDVRVDCKGRVVRSFEDSGRKGVGVVIDEYRFDRR